jgi:phage terminase large subunit-like protein
MGIKINGGWLDEEPPTDIWSQYLRSTISTNGILYMTFTPEEGITEVVNGFMNDLKSGQALINATWHDAPHLMADGKLTDRAQQLWSAFPDHEREMRSKGVPFMGSGLVFPFTEEQLVVDPFPIPRHWPQIMGIDFGYDHPFGAARLAVDRDSDIVYVVSDYSESGKLPPIHVAAIKPWGAWIPVAWPHDGLNTEKTTGDELRQPYADLGLLMLPERATNPPDYAQGQAEGEGGNSVEAAILSMHERMETGRWKVFRTCRNWLGEQRMYHRKINQRGMSEIVKIKDDVISASRAAHMMLRHARTETVRRAAKREYVVGATNWG